MQYSFFLTALCATCALAITVTSPAMNTQWKDNDSNTITWTSVSSDPESLNIVLVNEHVNPPVSITLATNVPTSQGSYTVTSLTGTGPGYQINLVSTTQSDGILAQSQQFELESGGGSASSSGTSSTASTASTTSTASTASTVSTSTLTQTSTLSGASSATTTVTDTATVTGSTTSGVTLATVTTTKATGSATGTGATTGSGTATASTTAATGSNGAEAKVASLAGVAIAGLFALLV